MGENFLSLLKLCCPPPPRCSPPSWMVSFFVDREGPCLLRPVWGDGWRLKMQLFQSPKGPLWPLPCLFLARGRGGAGVRHPVLGVTERSGKALYPDDCVTPSCICPPLTTAWLQMPVLASSPDTCLTQEKQEAIGRESWAQLRCPLGSTLSGSPKGRVTPGGIRSSSRFPR